MEPYLGYCHIQKTDDLQQGFTTIAAVYCSSHVSYDAELKTYLALQGYHLAWSIDVYPEKTWLAQNLEKQLGEKLAGSVNSHHVVEVAVSETVGTYNGGAHRNSHLLIKEHSIRHLPDQSAIPFWDREWISPDLKDLLFGQIEERPTTNTYLIFDAALRKDGSDLIDLDRIDVPFKCLFTGDSATNLKEAAPHLVDMTLPTGSFTDSDLVPSFHKEFFRRHWGSHTGIIIRSQAGLSDIWKHFRRFSRMQVEEDKRWLYFRFWDPRVAPYYFDSIKNNPLKSAQWFNLRGNSHIDCIFGDQTEKEDVWSVSPITESPDKVGSTGVPQLSRAELDALELYSAERVTTQISKGIGLAAPSIVQEMGKDQVREIVKASIAQSRLYGVVLDTDIAYFSYLSCIHTTIWHYHDFYSAMNTVLRDGTIAPYLKMDLIESRFQKAYQHIDTVDAYERAFSGHPTLGNPQYFDDFRQSLNLDRSTLL